GARAEENCRPQDENPSNRSCYPTSWNYRVYDPNYGAKPVKRVIQQNVENEFAKGILRGEFKEEDTFS
ncbi:chaperone protein ClpB3 chloroplastic-like, partial [Trifolium medium]|nr:chaperone protein ClpB3 chloroplastic-like [Trifolium medium]